MVWSNLLEFMGEVSKQCHHQNAISEVVCQHMKNWFSLNAVAFELNSVTTSNSFMPFPISLCAFGTGVYKH